MDLSLPLLVLGKGPAGHLPGGYEIRVRHPGFDAPAVEAIQGIRNGFEWVARPGGAVHASCFGLWPLESQPPRALLLRFSDQGRDDLGRPHCLRIDAALITSAELLGSGEALAGLMQAGAWPREAPGADGSDLVELRPEPPAPELARRIDQNRQASRQPPSILAGVLGAFRNTAFALVHGSSSEAEVSREQPLPPVRPQPVELSRQAAPPRTEGRVWMGRGLAALVCFALGLLGGLWLGHPDGGGWRSEARRLELELQRQEKQLESSIRARSESLAAENTALKNRIRLLEEALRKIRELAGHELDSSPSMAGDGKPPPR